MDCIISLNQFFVISDGTRPHQTFDRLQGPPQVPVGNFIVTLTRHEKDASQEDIDLLEAHLLAELLVGHGDNNVNEPLFCKAHTEECKLIVFGDWVPPVIRELSGKVLKVAGTRAAICWSLPCTATRRRGFLRRRFVLGCRLVVAIDLYPLPPEFVDLLPCCSVQQTTVNVGDSITV
jgi:hypothetical protein